MHLNFSKLYILHSNKLKEKNTTVGIFSNFNLSSYILPTTKSRKQTQLECKYAHPNDNSCEVSLQSDNIKKTTFIVTIATAAILEFSSPKSTTTHLKDHSCEISLQSDQNYFYTFIVTMTTTVVLKFLNHCCDVSLHTD